MTGCSLGNSNFPHCDWRQNGTKKQWPRHPGERNPAREPQSEPGLAPLTVVCSGRQFYLPMPISFQTFRGRALCQRRFLTCRSPAGEASQICFSAKPTAGFLASEEQTVVNKRQYRNSFKFIPVQGCRSANEHPISIHNPLWLKSPGGL